MAEDVTAGGGEEEEQSEDENEVISKAILAVRDQRGKKIDLSQMNLAFIPKKLYQLQHLQYLYLEKNLLEILPECFAESFPQLTWLDMRHNKLKCLPENISLLANLKNLLLEGNNITKLPLQIGKLSRLSGLNLADNPIEFPSKDIIKAGTKEILRFLREQGALEERFGNINLNEHDQLLNSHYAEEDYPEVNKMEVNQQDEQEENFSDTPSYDRNDIDWVHENHGQRRHSLEERKLIPTQYRVNPLDVLKTHVSPLRKRELSSAPVRKTKPAKVPVTTKHKKQTGYFRDETAQSRFQRDVEDNERKKINAKADVIIQKQKNKQSLDDWRRKSRQLQREKQQSKSPKHEIHIPFGNELQQDAIANSKHAEAVNRRLTEKNSLARELRDKQLEDRIQEHAKNIRDWKRTTNILTVEDEIKIAKNNLQKALQLQKDLDEKRQLEYRLRAFTGEDYVPAIRTKKK